MEPKQDAIEERVAVTRTFVGACHMQVCAVRGATDEEILDTCNARNPSGTTHGWARVIRDAEEWCGGVVPGPSGCEDSADREHLMVAC